MLNQSGLEASHVGNYIENYLDAMENLSNLAQPQLSEIFRSDIEGRANLQRLDEIKTTLNEKMEEHEKSVLINEIKQLIYRGQIIGDRKIACLDRFIELVNDKLEQLDRDAQILEPSTENSSTTQIRSTQPSGRRPMIASISASGQQRMTNGLTPSFTSSGSADVASSSGLGGNGGRLAQSRVRRQRVQKSFSELDLDIDLREKNDSISSDLNCEKGRKRNSGRNCRSVRKKNSKVTTPDEPTYCLCDQISFGEMIGCDYTKCSIEWFHFECVDLKSKPKGKWFCPHCRGDKMSVVKPTLLGK